MDEYEISAETFAPTDAVLDIGPHAWLFSYLCHRRDSRAPYPYEPESSNFPLLARSLRGLAWVHLYSLAVFRRDGVSNERFTHSGYNGDITGGGNVMLRGRALGFEAQEVSPSTGTQPVVSISFDGILCRLGRVRSVRLDGERSEFPIFLTGRELAVWSESLPNTTNSRKQPVPNSTLKPRWEATDAFARAPSSVI